MSRCFALAVIAAMSLPCVAHAQHESKSLHNPGDPLVPPLFDCSKIHELGIDRQVNFRAQAIMIFCGEAEGGSATAAGKFSRFIQRLLPSPLAYGTMDVNLITGTETFPSVTQSTTFSAANPDDPLQIVVAYNDSRGRNSVPVNLGGASVSTDGSNTFVRLTNASGQSPFAAAGNNNGGPVVLYNKSTATWFTVWLDAGCGGDQSLGGYKSSTPWDPNSWTHFCIHTSSLIDDQESGWVDNNTSSLFYGRMYVSWSDYGRGQPFSYVTPPTVD